MNKVHLASKRVSFLMRYLCKRCNNECAQTSQIMDPYMYVQLFDHMNVVLFLVWILIQVKL